MSPDAVLSGLTAPDGFFFRSARLILQRWQTHLWVALWMCANFGLAFYQAQSAGANPIQFRILWTALAVGLFWSGSLSLVLIHLPRPLAGPLVVAGTVYAALFVAASCFHLLVYGDQLGVSSILAIADTSSSESSEFLASTLTLDRLAVVLAVGVGVLCAGLLVRFEIATRNPSTFGRHNALPLAVVLIGFLGATVLLHREVTTFRLNNPFMASWTYGREVLRVKDMVKDFSPGAPRKVGAVMAAGAVGAAESPSSVHLLILGESVTSRHLSVYGYGRETTPEMARKAPGYEGFVVADVCSARHNTAEALVGMMTGGGRPGESMAHWPSVISMAREAGYRVAWVSNQTAAGDVDSMSSAWARQADERIFISFRGLEDGVTLDEQLVPHVERLLAERRGPLVVIVHMMGAHQNYAQRYPAAFATWTDDAPVPETVPRRHHADFPQTQFNRYDNAVRYTDHVVGMLRSTGARRGAATVTYVSDHGQNLGEYSAAMFHSLPDGPRQGFEVPLLFWVADGWLSPKAAAVLRRNLTVPYQTDRLPETLLELYRVTHPGMQADESLLSPEFVAQERRCDSMAW